MCWWSKNLALDLAQTGDRLVIARAKNPHTANRWFVSVACNKQVCIPDATPMLIRKMDDKAFRLHSIPETGLVFFREIRDTNGVNGDFIEFPVQTRAKRLPIGALAIDMELEVVSKTFADTITENPCAISAIDLVVSPPTKFEQSTNKMAAVLSVLGAWIFGT